MRGFPVRELRRRIPVMLDEEEARRVIGLLEDFKPQHARLQPARAGVQPRRRQEGRDALRFHRHLHMDDQHKGVIAEIFFRHKYAGKENGFW